MIWENIEKIAGERIPSCIQKILSSCAYNSLLTLKNITQETILSIEKFVDTNRRDLIDNLSCSHAEFYRKQCKFQILPGHRDFILSLSKTIQQHDQGS